MKITDISKIDIKDIDAAKIKDQLLQHKEVVVQIILGACSLFFAVSLFNQSQTEVTKYKTQIATLQAKAPAIEQYNKTQMDVKDYLKKVPEAVSEDKIINLVTDIAVKNGVKILTFNPANIDKRNSLETLSLRFTLVADSFLSMVRFMADIERGKDFLQIWECEADPQLNAKSSTNNKGSAINFRMEVASIMVEK